MGPAKTALRGVSLVALVAPFAGAGDGGDDALGVDLADGAAFAFADVGVALAIDADGPGADDDRLVGRAAVAALAAIDLRLGRDLGLAGAGEGGDDAGREVEPANAPVGDVGDQQAPLAVEDSNRWVRACDASVALPPSPA